ncbi:unnamed protein product [Cuscuta epithymum]|uniref:Uncharacterized protein n=1 Tax=Cuscuta epithymum TaxID=186058 RepID=A0AAV0GC33_9ASTE|nr:unnamed protein product [Cuscuta epithymum]
MLKTPLIIFLRPSNYIRTLLIVSMKISDRSQLDRPETSIGFSFRFKSVVIFSILMQKLPYRSWWPLLYQQFDLFLHDGAGTFELHMHEKVQNPKFSCVSAKSSIEAA